MISNYRRLWAFAVVFCLLFLMGCADSDERIGEIDYSEYTVSLGRISHTGTMISYNEIAEFLDENQALLERVIALSCVEQVENPTVLNRAVCLLEVGEHSSIVNKAFVYLPVVDQKGTLIKLISLRRTENGLEYSIEELGVIGEALEKYPGEDLVLVQVPSHLAVCVIAPDNRIFSNFSTEMFDPRTDYYDHFKTEYNVINADWYN